MILNPECVCKCGRPKTQAAPTCAECKDKTYPKQGRRPTYTDEQILDAIEAGAHTPNALLTALGLKSKTTLIKRLRKMREAGLVNLIERTRREGFTVTSERRA